MRSASSVLTFIIVALFSFVTFAQEPSVSVPRLINITGAFRPADGQPPAAVETVTLAIYADEQGGTPLWQETQTVTLDDRGRYSLLLGATSGGIPPEIFGSTAPHWLGTRFERPGEVEGARVRLTSVPYALRAANADTLGGRPASDYLLAAGQTSDGMAATPATRSDVAAPAGTANFIPKYVDGINFGDSVLYNAGTQVGLGTTTPFDMFHISFNNPGGNFTGLAVQNTSGSVNAFSGMLFFDHNNQLGQFQGYNNVSHEYRINNIAKNGAQFDGSINFMIGSTSRFFVGANGNIGIGTTTPTTNLEVSNALSPAATTSATLTTYFNGFGSNSILARRARGTAAAPTALQAFDTLLELNTRGYGATGFGPSGVALISMGTSQNWTDTAQGTQISFATTSNNSTTPGTRMVIANSGNVGIGTFSPISNLEVSNALSGSTFGQVTTSTFNNTGAGSLFVGSRARGTSAAPTAVQGGDILGGFLGRGYFAGATPGFSGTRGGMFVLASENWTDTAQGTLINFNTTATGTTTPGTRVTISPSGDVGIGTTFPQGAVEIVRQGSAAFHATTYSGASKPGEFNFVTRSARGTPAAPAAVQSGDELGGFGATGYGTTEFGNFGAGISAFAAENWTDTAQGAALVFGTTPLGSSDGEINAIIMPGGNTGIGTFTAFPVITDKLQVFGDIRVGTTGTNGCVKGFDGTGLIGTCSSDRRLKKNITPFAPALDKLTALQPVHYYWRAEDFPNRHFGNRRTYGLIAQDVEQVLPEIVATDSDGYKAIDYTKLPLLTIQAMKELKAKNDALQQRIDQLEPLKERVAEMDALQQRVLQLERLLSDMIAAKGRQ